MLRPGTYLQDRYEILEKIGSGGMSVVYKAKCHKLNRLVAIKVLNEDLSSDSSFVAKFKMEAQAAAGLSHPNIVNVYDVVDEGSLHYIVMELIEGITLKSYIAKKGRLSAKETIGIAIQVAQGIAAAHSQNIVHRDIKPQNMIISRDGKVKVADFGIARAVSNQTINASAIGSVHYMAPEQARGGFSDTRSDIYSLGITMYEMVTGRPPFDGDNTVSVALSHLQENITPPHVYNPDVTDSLEQIIMKCTRKRPDDRYADVAGLISDLRRALLHPDEAFVMEEADPFAQTTVIGSDDLARIKERSVDPVEFASRPPQHRPVRGPAPSKLSSLKKHPQQEDVNPQLEKLLTGAGVLAAVIIVAVLVFVFFRLGGIFNAGSGGRSPEQIASESQNGLKDTEVYMPEVLDLPVDMAEERLKKDNLSMKITGYEYSDQYEKDRIMYQSFDAGSIVPKWSNIEVVVSQGSNKVDLSTLIPEGSVGEAIKSLLEGKKFQVEVVELNDDLVEAGKVIRYAPLKVEPEGLVTLYVSKGPELAMVPIPNLVGKTDDEAIALLVEVGLVPSNMGEVFSNSVPAGQVAIQESPAETQVEVGTVIGYSLSKGPEESESMTESSSDVETSASGASVTRGKYVAAINQTYDISSLIGPGSGGTSVQLMVRLRQHVNGKDVYRTLMDPKTITGNTILPVVYSQIDGAYGVDTGTVEVVDVQTGAVLKTYGLSFFEVY